MSRVSIFEAGVRTREYCHYITVLRPIVSFHDELVGPCDQREAIVMVESLRDVLAKSVAGTARANTPAAPVIRVGPQ